MVHPRHAILGLALVVAFAPAQAPLFLGPNPLAPDADPLENGFAGFLGVADLVLDGRPDILMGWSGGSPTLAVNQDSGFFAMATASPTSDFLSKVRFGDLDGDGDADVAALRTQGSTVSWSTYANDAQGRLLRHPPSAATYPNASFLALGDVDGDRDLDLVVGHASSGVASPQNRLYLNNGAAAFTEATQGRLPYIQDDTRAVELADLDGDADLDLFVVNWLQQDELHLNDGTGSFTRVTTTHLFPMVETSSSVAVGDVDGDRDADLLVGGEYPGKARLCLNDGSARFTAASQAQLPSWSANDVALLDVDNDNDLDALLVVHSAQPQLLLNDGRGTFTNATAARLPQLATYSYEIQVMDLEGDGDIDLLLENHPAFPTQPTKDVVLVNDGAGTFQVGLLPVKNLSRNLPPVLDSTDALALVDVDGDRDLDLIVGNDLLEQDRFYRNDGLGVFQEDKTVLPPDASNTTDLAVGDVDGNGTADLVAAAWNDQTRLLLLTASGTYTDATATRMPQAIANTTSVALGDIDGDGDLDLVSGIIYQSTVYRNDGTGRFTDDTFRSLPPLYDWTEVVRLGDLDRDGDLDLLLGNGNQGTKSRVLRNDGTGVFAEIPSALPVAMLSAVLGDFDADGALDVFFGQDPRWSGAYGVHLWRNQGSGAFKYSYAHYSRYNGLPRAIVAGDFDGNGRLDAAIGSCSGPAWSPCPGELTEVLMASSGNSFTPSLLTPQSLITTYGPTHALASGDLDSDGDIDLVVGNTSASQNRVYLNLSQHLDLPAFTRIGRTLNIEAYSLPSIGTSWATQTLLSAGLQRVDLSPYGVLWLDLSSAIALPVVPTVGGVARSTIPLPNDPSLAGATLYVQSVVQRAAAPFVHLTNAWKETIYP